MMRRQSQAEHRRRLAASHCRTSELIEATRRKLEQLRDKSQRQLALMADIDRARERRQARTS